MTPLTYVLIAIALVYLSLFLLKKKTPFVSRRSVKYVTRRQNIRLAGVLLLFPAGLSLTMAVLLSMTVPNLPVVEKPPPHFDLDTPAPVVAAPAQPDPNAELKLAQELDAKLEKLNATLKAHPNDAQSYADRGNVYAAKKSWQLAEKDYQTALKLDNKIAKAAFNLAEMEFVQKKYDSARPGFLALENDPHLGDLASYKVFLCDLYGGHEAEADKELDIFNQESSEASYYFSNIAWFLYHKNSTKAAEWLTSANRIYAPYKIDLYSASLTQLGYLPLPTPQYQLGINPAP